MKKKYLKPEISAINVFKEDILTLSAIEGDIGNDGRVSWNQDIENGGI